jgi:hypothetical protein
MYSRRTLLLVLALALLAGFALGTTQAGRALADKDDKAVPCTPRFSVLETEGHNLIATDNQTCTLYFYTVDANKPIGSELRLRATIDLHQVGKEVIRPKVTGKAPAED